MSNAFSLWRAKSHFTVMAPLSSTCKPNPYHGGWSAIDMLLSRNVAELSATIELPMLKCISFSNHRPMYAKFALSTPSSLNRIILSSVLLNPTNVTSYRNQIPWVINRLASTSTPTELKASYRSLSTDFLRPFAANVFKHPARSLPGWTRIICQVR